MSVEHHQIHHSPPHEYYYCITSGWLNRPLDAIGFWTKAEAFIEYVFNVKPFKDDDHTPTSTQAHRLKHDISA